MKSMTLLLAAVLLMAPAALADLKIVTTLPDYADLARQIGGDKVEVHSVMKGPENVHNVLAKPTEMLKLNQADMFVHSGLDAEPWRDNLVKGARNPRILPNKPGNVDMSRGLDLLDVPAGPVDRSMGDIHAYGNPHFSPDPRSAQRMAATLVKAMAELDPDNAALYRDNAKAFVNDMADLHRALLEEIKPVAGLKIATYHRAWPYFADAFGLEIAAVIEPQPGITPSPAQLARTIEQLKAQDVKVVVVETYNSYDQAKYVADRAGARVIVLPDHVNGLPEVRSYQDLFRHNIRQLLEAAQAAGVSAGE